MPQANILAVPEGNLGDLLLLRKPLRDAAHALWVGRSQLGPVDGRLAAAVRANLTAMSALLDSTHAMLDLVPVAPKPLPSLEAVIDPEDTLDALDRELAVEACYTVPMEDARPPLPPLRFEAGPLPSRVHVFEPAHATTAIHGDGDC